MRNLVRTLVVIYVFRMKVIVLGFYVFELEIRSWYTENLM